MKNFRKAVFWLHLCLGVTGGVVIFIMCVTGAALSFEKNIIEAFEADQRRVTPAEGRIAPREALMTAVEARPGAKPTGMLFSSDPTAAGKVSGPQAGRR